MHSAFMVVPRPSNGRWADSLQVEEGLRMMIIPESQIRALIRLLSDEDDRIVETISGRLIDIGPSAVPLLQEAEIEQPEMADRIASILEEIRGGKLEDELVEQASRPDDAMSL